MTFVDSDTAGLKGPSWAKEARQGAIAPGPLGEGREAAANVSRPVAGGPSVGVNTGSSARAARAPADNKPAGSESS